MPLHFDPDNADRISTQIVDLMNAELESQRPDLRPLDILCGQLLALLALSATFPPNKETPFEIDRVMNSARVCIASILRFNGQLKASGN